MSFSLNEMEAMAKRATRGAGYSWGASEEAAKATRWLCTQGFDGAAALNMLLELGFAKDAKSHTPYILDGVWACDQQMCALLAGAFLSDYAHLLSTQSVEINDLACPELLLPFVAAAARKLECCFTIDCDGLRITCDGNALSSQPELPPTARLIVIRKADEISLQHPLKTRAETAPETWESLNRFAHKTYAPATEESRLLGAGAGLSDND